MQLCSMNLWIFFLFAYVKAEADVLCKSFGKNSNNDFCVSLSTYVNAAISKQDFIFAFNRTQHDSAGWTSLGIGTLMDGALLFTLYGDPDSEKPPTLSVRSTTAHMPPLELTYGDQHQRGVHIGYIETSWEQSGDGKKKWATASFTCYGCNAWYNADISASTLALPLMWAINTNQNFSTTQYSENAMLEMHERYGKFTLDMNKETTQPSHELPDTIVHSIELNPSGIADLSEPTEVKENTEGPTDDNPRYIKNNRKFWFLHGILLAASFYVILPGGILLLRIGSPQSFYFHLFLQAIGSMIAVSSMAMGFIMSHQIHAAHQFIGILICFGIVFQPLLGWLHHVSFVQLRRTTWMISVHSWLGWGVLIGGWTNLILGLHLSDYTFMLKSWFVVGAIFEFCVLFFINFRHRSGEPVGKNFDLNRLIPGKKIPWFSRDISAAGGIDRYFSLNDENTISSCENAAEEDESDQENKRETS